MPAEGEVVSEIPSGAQPRRTKGTAATGASGGRFGEPDDWAAMDRRGRRCVGPLPVVLHQSELHL